MNALVDLLLGDTWLQALLQIVLLVSAFAAAALALVRFDRGPTARRHAFALVGLGAIAATPFLVPIARTVGTGIALLGPPPVASSATLPPPDIAAAGPGTPIGAVQTEVVQSGHAAGSNTPSATGDAESTPPALAFALPPLGMCLALLWLLAGATLALRRLAHGRRLRLHLAQLPLADLTLQNTAAAIARSLGMPSAPPIHLAEHACPATIGGRHPRLLLPTDVATAFAPATTHAILRHELAHLALGHHRHAALQTLLLAWFGWHPLVRRLNRTLDRLHEDLADNAAVAHRSTDEAIAYARSLVALAERATARLPAPTLSILGGSPFRHRIERLLHGATETMIHVDTKGRLLATAATAAALFMPFSLQLLPPQTPQDPATDPRSAAAWVPLLPGHRLTWRVTGHAQDREIAHEAESYVWGEVPLGDDGTCVQVFEAESSGGGPHCSYWRADATGLWRFANTYIGMRGASAHGTRLIPGPIGSETRWEWDEVLPVQTMVSAGQEAQPIEYPKAHHVGELLAMNEEVTVPAGTFAALHIRTTSSGAIEGVRDEWFAPGIGLVKSAVTQEGAQMTRELLRHVTGKAAATDPATVLKNALGIQRSEPVTWLPLASAALHVHGRIAVVRPRAGTPSCWFVADRAFAIGVDDLGAWQQIAAALRDSDPKFTIEVADRRALSLVVAEPVLVLAELATRIECARRNLRIVRTTDSQTTSGGRDNKITATCAVVAKDLGDTDRELSVDVEYHAGQLIALKITSDVPAPAEQDLPPQQVGPQPGQIRDR